MDAPRIEAQRAAYEAAAADLQRARAAALAAWRAYRRASGRESHTPANRLPGEPVSVHVAELVALGQTLAEALAIVAAIRQPTPEDQPQRLADSAAGLIDSAMQRLQRIARGEG